MKRCLLFFLMLSLVGTVVAEDKYDEGYNISFDQVEIRNFIKIMGDDILKDKKFVVGEGIKGKITIVAPRIKRADAYPLFVQILESAGCSVVKDGDIHRIVLLGDRATHLAPVIKPGGKTPAGGLVTKIFRLIHVQANDVRKVIEPLVGGGKTGGVGSIEATGHLIVTDTAESIRRIETLVKEIDQEGVSRTTELVPLKHAGAEELAEQLNMAMREGVGRGERLVRRLTPTAATQAAAVFTPSAGRWAIVVPSTHSNSLILRGTPAQIAELKSLIARMDVDVPSGRGRWNAIFLKYISAEDAAKSITALLTKLEKTADQKGRHKMIAVEASVANNALIVDASPGDFDVVRRLVDQLDIAPEQVHIDVVILEVGDSKGLSLGVEMAALEMPDEVGNTVVQGASILSAGANSLMNSVQSDIFPQGITVRAAFGSRTDADGNLVTSFPGLININALKQSGSVRIRSETSLGVQNNQEAEVVSVNEIPILESVLQGAGQDRESVQNIKRIEVGVRLKLTPHIIPGGQVRMILNTSIEAVIDQGPAGTPFTPTIARRTVGTTVTIPNGETIVIAGLTREDETKVVRKVPILGSIPVLGVLFRNTVDTKETKNVLIFVTPHILNSEHPADRGIRDWEKKTGVSVHGGE